jgi:hypothetical protein
MLLLEVIATPDLGSAAEWVSAIAAFLAIGVVIFQIQDLRRTVQNQTYHGSAQDGVLPKWHGITSTRKVISC